MDTTIQKSYYYFLTNFIKEHLNLLQESRVFIFGAGIRGCNLLMLLRAFHIEDVYFVDNSPQKQGEYIENCFVMSFAQAKEYSKKHIFLCPIENGKSILEQLEESGRKENKDYFNLDFYLTDYADIVEEVMKAEDNFTLIFGCCILSSHILGEKIILPLGEKMKSELFGEACKLCALPGFSPEMYYHILNVLLLRGQKPRCVLMALDFSSLSPYNSVMMGKQNQEQHELFVERLTELVPENKEIQDFLNLNKKRLEKAMHGGTLATAGDSKEAIRKVYKLKYLFTMQESDDSVVYTKKILKQMNEMNIPVFIQFQPIDYERGMDICGEDFQEKYCTVKERFLSFLQEYSYYEIDASFIATPDYFVSATSKPDINPFLNEKGQEVLIRFLREQEVLQPYCSGVAKEKEGESR